MSNHRITCDGFGKGGTLQQFFLFDKLLFDAPMLIAQLNFEMKDLLAVADKSEMSRLDNPGMYRTNANFVKFITFDGKKRIVGKGF